MQGQAGADLQAVDPSLLAGQLHGCLFEDRGGAGAISLRCGEPGRQEVLVEPGPQRLGLVGREAVEFGGRGAKVVAGQGDLDADARGQPLSGQNGCPRLPAGRNLGGAGEVSSDTEVDRSAEQLDLHGAAIGVKGPEGACGVPGANPGQADITSHER